jgi:hypothetical protein
MSLRLSLVLALAAAGCARQAPQVRAPSSTPTSPMFDVSRICTDPSYQSICEEKQAPAALPTETPIRVDTNLATPPSTLGFQG